MTYAECITDEYRAAAEMYRMFANLSLCEEARIDYEAWAVHYEYWANLAERQRVDYLAITRDVANMP